MELKIWADSMNLNNTPHTDMEYLLNLGYTFVMASSCALDVTYFQNNPTWVLEKIKEGKLVIEHWNKFEDMFQKRFHWTSLGKISTSGEPYEVLEKLPKGSKLIELYEVLKNYGIPCDQWNIVPSQIPTDFTSRTEALIEYKTTNHMHLFNEFNRRYTHELAVQHGCQFILGKGAIIMV